MEHDGKKQLLFGGRNTFFKTSSVCFTVNSFSYEMKIPDKNRFLVLYEIDGFAQDAHLDLNKLFFYDSAGQTITNRIYFSRAELS